MRLSISASAAKIEISREISSASLDRARRIVNVVTGLSYDDADALLKRSKGNVKAAIVMQKTGLTLPQAMKRLRKSDNSVREAIGEDIEPRLREILGAR